MADYEELRQRHSADALALAPALIEPLGWPRQRLAAHRTERLRALVRTAVARSPWHRQRLGNLDLERLDEATLHELPVMTKDDLMEHFDEIVTDDRLGLQLVNGHLGNLPDAGYLLEDYTVIASSGSSGRRGVFVYDWQGWATFYISLFRYVLRAVALDPALQSGPVTMANVAASHPTHATAALSRTFSSPALKMLRLPVTLPVEDIVAGLNDAQPVFLHGYPSALHLLTHEAKAGRLRIAPGRVLTSSEPLLPEIRAAVEDTGGVPVGNCWGASEGGGMAVACDLAGTHLNEDLHIVEPVDDQGGPVPAGVASSKLYLTNLYNQTVPLIRYEITDQVAVMDEPCPCGSAHRRIGDIHGRLDDTFVYGGVVVHPLVFRSPLAQRPNILEYQVRQTPTGADVAVRCNGSADVRGLDEDIRCALGRLGLVGLEVRVSVVDQLERGATGKLKRFVPLAV
jgi:phenylacetate-CoA ligase